MNDLLPTILFQEADMVIGALSVTTERERIIDFTLAYYDYAGIQILMKRPLQDKNLFRFMTVFTGNILIIKN